MAIQKYVKLGVYELAAMAIIVFGTLLLVMYSLTRLLYSKQMALGCLLILSLGSIPILILEVSPLVYADILVLGACAFLLACGLALSASPQPGQKGRGWRVLGYGCWGVVAGLGVWSDPLVLPYVAAAGLR